MWPIYTRSTKLYSMLTIWEVIPKQHPHPPLDPPVCSPASGRRQLLQAGRSGSAAPGSRGRRPRGARWTTRQSRLSGRRSSRPRSTAQVLPRRHMGLGKPRSSVTSGRVVPGLLVRNRITSILHMGEGPDRARRSVNLPVCYRLDCWTTHSRRVLFTTCPLSIRLFQNSSYQNFFSIARSAPPVKNSPICR